MSKFDDVVDSFAAILGIGFVSILILLIIIGCIGCFGQYNERHNMKELNFDKDYLFTTKMVEGHNVLIISNRYDDKSFQVLDLGEINVKKLENPLDKQ